MNSRKKILLSIPTERAKVLLDSPVFDALAERYQVDVVSYLADRPEIVKTYGRDGVRFVSWTDPSGRAARFSLRLTASMRMLGHQRRWRKEEPGLSTAWIFTTTYRDLGQRSRARKIPILGLSLLAGWKRAYRATARIALAAAMRESSVRGRLGEIRPDVVILTGQPSDQDQILSTWSSSQGIRTLWYPISPDDVYSRGYSMLDHDVVCAWGPWMRERLERLFDVPPSKIVNSGNLYTRLQTELLDSGDKYDLYADLDIPPGARVVTYLSNIGHTATETVPAVEALSDLVESGRIGEVIIVLRVSPFEDPGPLLAHFRDHRRVRVQIGADGGFDQAGDRAIAQHALTLSRSSVVVAGSMTSSVHQTLVWGVPTIVNSTELSPYRENSYSPSGFVAADNSGLFALGLRYATTLEELCEMVADYLKRPDKDAEAIARMADYWDYQNENYVDEFINAVDSLID